MEAPVEMAGYVVGNLYRFASQCNRTESRCHYDKYHDKEFVRFIQVDYTTAMKPLLYVEAECARDAPCRFWVKESELVKP